LGWTTLPGLRGLSVSDFRAEPTQNPDADRGVAAEFADDRACQAFLQTAAAEFATRRFSNAAEAFDTVKAYVLEHTGNRS
jgi:hypothetical protein